MTNKPIDRERRVSKTKTKIAYVHAWEYVNVTMAYPTRKLDAGGSGFDWYVKKADAEKAFHIGNGLDQPVNTADFYFEVKVPANLTRAKATALIDANLHDHCAHAKCRRVGINVLTYWRRNKFKMGGATRPTTTADSR